MWLCELLLVALLVAAAALHDGLHPLVVDYDEHYYYTSLRAKMAESLSISNCSVGGDVAAGPRGPRAEKFKAGKAGTADIMVRKLTPPPSVVSKWSPDNRARPGRLFALVTGSPYIISALSALLSALSALCSLLSALCSLLSLLSALCSLLSALSALCSLLSGLWSLVSALCSLLSRSAILAHSYLFISSYYNLIILSTSDPLCVSDKYKNVLKGRYKRAKVYSL
jgi:hypothetical protein